MVDLWRANLLLQYRGASDGQLLYEAQVDEFFRFKVQAIHTWCDLGSILERAYQAVLELYK